MLKKQHIFLFIVFIVGIAIASSGFFVTQFIENKLHDNFVDYFAQQEYLIAKQIALRFETDIKGIERQLRILSEVKEINVGSDECNIKTENILKSITSRLHNVIRVGKDGAYLCSPDKMLVGTSAHTVKPYLLDLVNDPKHKSVISRAVKTEGKDDYVTEIHIPVFDQERNFSGTLGGMLSFKDFQEKYLKDITFAQRGFVVLLDDDGTILYHQNRDLIGLKHTSDVVTQYIGESQHWQYMIDAAKAGRGGTTFYMHKSEGQKIAGFEPINIFDNRQWIAVVTIPVDTVNTELIGMQIQTLLDRAAWLIAVAIFSYLIIFLWLVHKFIFRPLGKIDQMKSDFVSLASHQLRTPLTAIKWNAELLQGQSDSLSTDANDCVKEIEQATKRMVSLVNSLLDVSRLELGNFTIEPIEANLITIAEIAIREQNFSFSEKKQNFSFSHIPKLPLLLLDTKITHILFQNLLSNACKYTPEGGAIKLVIKTEKNLNFGEHIIIQCIDNGYGIPLEAQPHIFSKLFRADNIKTLNIEGTGLGLYVIKTMVETAGCDISFVSKEGKGTTFTIRIPITGMTKPKGTMSSR